MRTWRGRDYYSILETADKLEMSGAMVSRMVQNGEFEGCMRGQQRTLWIPVAAVVHWKENNPTKSTMVPFDPNTEKVGKTGRSKTR